MEIGIQNGFVDLLIDAVGYSSNTGATYMIFGHNGTWVASKNASGVGTSVSGVKLIGDSDSYSGNSVSNGGDVNADSIDDFVIGGPIASPQVRANAGRAWIVFGRNETGNWTGMMNLKTLTLPDGVAK